MDEHAAPVDDFISAVPGNWRFDEQVTAGFDSHVRKSVPCYDEVQRLVVALSEFFVRDGGRVFDIGSSTGATVRLLAEAHGNKHGVRFVGIDQSISMVHEARRNCSELSNVRLIHQDVTTFDDFSGASLIISLYTLQFLDLQDRYSLVRKLHSDLRVGGAFILVDKVFAEHAVFEHLWNEAHWDYKRREGLSDDMILDKSRSLRGVLTPMTARANLTMLRRAGFSALDVFFKWMGFAGILAIKTAPATGSTDTSPPTYDLDGPSPARSDGTIE